MFDYIEKLRAKSPRAKKQIAFLTALFLAGIIWASGDIIGIFFPSGVGNIAHLSGMFVGILFGLAYRQKSVSKGSREVFFKENELRRWEDENLR